MTHSTRNLVICLKNDGYEVSLERRKIYLTIPDETAAKLRLLRVIDESGEDYLYPAEYFVVVEVPRETARALSKSFARSVQPAA